MNTRQYQPKDFDDLIALHKTQNYADIGCLSPRTLPDIGFIAYDNDTPVAAGFLRRLEPCYAQIDTLVSNGTLSSAARHVGVSTVVDCLLAEAKRLNLEGVLALTSDAGVLKRAEVLGFKRIYQTPIGIRLT